MKPTRPSRFPKAIAAARKISAFNSEIAVEPDVSPIWAGQCRKVAGGMQLVLDGTDNFETRYLINDFAVKTSVPWIYTAAVGSYGITLNVLPGQTACLACVFPDQPRGALRPAKPPASSTPAVNLAASISGDRSDQVSSRCSDQHLRRTLLSFDVWRNERGGSGNWKPAPGMPRLRRARLYTSCR